MKLNPRICIVVPFYNEESHILHVWSMLDRSGLPFVFVNDGSTDRTKMILEDIRKKTDYFPIISYTKNIGKGFALRQGAYYAIDEKHGLNADYVLFFDSDRQNTIDDIKSFYEALNQHPQAKIIVGNRLSHAISMSIIRRLTNRIMSKIISILAGRNISDTQCGMRLVHKSVFDIQFKSDKFEFESEMLIRVGREGKEIISCSIKCIYHKNRRSKIRPFRDTIRFIKMLYELND